MAAILAHFCLHCVICCSVGSFVDGCSSAKYTSSFDAYLCPLYYLLEHAANTVTSVRLFRRAQFHFSRHSLLRRRNPAHHRPVGLWQNDLIAPAGRHPQTRGRKHRDKRNGITTVGSRCCRSVSRAKHRTGVSAPAFSGSVVGARQFVAAPFFWA